MMKLTKTLTTFGILALSVSLAQAADLPVRGPIYKAAPLASAFSWTGGYIGVHGGYAWGNLNVESGGMGGTDIKGGFGGGQIGYNWQSPGSNWVMGLEADVSGGDIGFSETILGLGSESSRINVMGTARGRLGFVVMPQTLIYGTGGLAWARNKAEANDGFIAESSTATHIGWAAGAGIEHAFARNWTVKAEYLHTDLGSESYFGGVTVLKADTDQVRVGINYLFH
jgi:outer membrane immunogenic protein